MKEYLHRFYSESDYQDYLNESYEEPTIGTIQSGISGELTKIFFNRYERIIEHHTYADTPLTFEVISAGTINWVAKGSNQTKTISYSKNSGLT